MRFLDWDALQTGGRLLRIEDEVKSICLLVKRICYKLLLNLLEKGVADLLHIVLLLVSMQDFRDFQQVEGQGVEVVVMLLSLSLFFLQVDQPVLLHFGFVFFLALLSRFQLLFGLNYGQLLQLTGNWQKTIFGFDLSLLKLKVLLNSHLNLQVNAWSAVFVQLNESWYDVFLILLFLDFILLLNLFKQHLVPSLFPVLPCNYQFLCPFSDFKNSLKGRESALFDFDFFFRILF